jgi:hypothetical protein
MARSKKERDPIPEHFKSIEEAAEFWDSHDLGDYWDLTREADFEVDIHVFEAARSCSCYESSVVVNKYRRFVTPERHCLQSAWRIGCPTPQRTRNERLVH